MTRTRNLSDLLDANGDVKTASLDNASAAVEATSNSNTFTDADHAKLNAIEASADVTDATNVASAGALMTSGGTVTGNINFGDNDEAIFGAGTDLRIYHNASNGNSHITESGSGSLVINGDNLYLQNTAGTENYIAAISNDAVTLYHDNSAKLATISTGVSVTGNIVATGTTGGVAKLRLAAEEVHGEIEGINIGNNFGGLAFKTNSNGTTAERMRIDSSGRVQINTTSGNERLNVHGAIGSSAASAAFGGGVERALMDFTGSVVRFGHVNGASGSAKPVTFLVAGGEKARLDASGNLGIGLTSGLDGKLHVSGNAVVGDSSTTSFSSFTSGGLDVAVGSGTKAFQVWDDNSTSVPRFTVERGGNVGINNVSPQKNLQITSSNASLRLEESGGGSKRLDLEIDNSAVAKIMANQSGSQIAFHTVGSERARFDSSGRLLIATSGLINNDGAYLQSNGGSNLAFGFNVNYDGTLGRFYRSSSIVGSISVTTSSTAYNTSSDRRLKSNIQDAESASYKIDAIQVRQFDWNADDSHQDYGLIAQELQPIEPMAVTGDADSDEMMGVDYSKLVPMLLKEIQSLRSRVAALES